MATSDEDAAVCATGPGAGLADPPSAGCSTAPAAAGADRWLPSAGLDFLGNSEKPAMVVAAMVTAAMVEESSAVLAERLITVVGAAPWLRSRKRAPLASLCSAASAGAAGGAGELIV